MIRHLIVPFICILLAVSTGYACFEFLQKDTSFSVLIGCCTFCILMVLWNYLDVRWTTQRTSRTFSQIIGFEKDLLRKLDSMELHHAQATEVEKIAGKVERLEKRTGQLPVNGQFNTGPSAADEFARREATNTDNVVPLKTGAKEPSLVKPSSVIAAKLSDRRDLKKLQDNHRLTVRLQPIVDLVSRDIIAVEAFGYFENDTSSIEANQILANSKASDKTAQDLNMLKELGRVVRAMEDDGQPVPVHLKLSQHTFADEAAFKKAADLLRSDTKLATILSIQLSHDAYAKASDETKLKLMELREYGTKPSLANLSGVDEINRILEEKHFELVKINTAELLRYDSFEGERVGDLLTLPDQDLMLVACEVEAAHQAANLLDLNIRYAQGEYFSEPRPIRIYAPETLHDNAG